MKRWLRREVLMPILFLAIYGGALFLLYRKLQQLQVLGTKGFMAWLFVASIVVYVVLIVMTFSHVSSTYILERYDPGDQASVRRLSRQLRFRLTKRWDGEAFVRNFPLALGEANFELEGGDRETGQVFARSGLYFWTRRAVYDRMLLVETGPINIFHVDKLLKGTIDQLDHEERPSRRNILVIAVRMSGRKNVASAAAGCVNYMGRFQSGTLFPILVDVNHKRMYFPINRHFISREHRVLQNMALSMVRAAGLRTYAAPEEDNPGSAPQPAERNGNS